MLFETLKKGRTFLPVIHLDGSNALESARKNMDIALNAGAEGVFLIEHGGGLSYYQLIEIASQVSVEYQELWVGINCLDIYDHPELVFAELIPEIGGVWIDKAGIGPNGCSQADKILESQLDSGWVGTYFGSIAFKYQLFVSDEDLPKVTELAKKYADVIVTSGSGTGVAADPERIRIIKEAAGVTPVAIASGVSIDNIVSFLDLGVNCFMVATSIQGKTFHDLDPRKTKVLCEAIKGRA